LGITHGAHREMVCWWNARTNEITWAEKIRQSFAQVSRDADLDQISAWCGQE
jgi:hypothetical protein